MNKIITILILVFVLFPYNAIAAFMNNVDVGSLEFRLDIKHSGSYVNYAKLNLVFQDFARLSTAKVFDNLTITHIGQRFVLKETDEFFDDAAAFLSNGLPDWIIASLTTPTRDSSVEATEPDALFGDPSGSTGIDFVGLSIKSIELRITDLHFIWGYDYATGYYTIISVQAVATINVVPNTSMPGVLLLLLDD
jgi:hypothetical protein